MSLHPGTGSYNPARNSDFARKAEALALGISNWSTPKASDGAKGGPGQSYGAGGTPPLPAQAAQWWTTPQAHDVSPRGAGQIPGPLAGNRCLARDAQNWATPAVQWPTPAAQNWKGSSEASVTRVDGKSRMDILHYRAEQGFTRPAPAITPPGLPSSPHAPISRRLWAFMTASHGRAVSRRIVKARARRRLNPLFVGWLMGWPIGHALCACSATDLAGSLGPWRSPARTRWQRHMRGALSQLPMASGPWIWRPAQMSLFEGLQP